MIEKVVIKDNKNTPIYYLSEIEKFKNGTVFEFKPGVNIIVGRNGSGKTTLLKLIERYLIVDKNSCSVGTYNSNITNIMGIKREMPVGVDVYADYEKNVFRLCHASEKTDDDIMSSFKSFGTSYMEKSSSTGEAVNIALNYLFNEMFDENAKLKFNYDELGEKYPSYGEYIKEHRVNEHNEWTVLMDEPDRNLDIENINPIKGILSFHKENTQVIAVIHNPLIIYALAGNEEINFIEMTEGYVNTVVEKINELLMA